MSGYMQYEMLLFLQSVLLGAVLLFCYDILRIFRNLIGHAAAAVACEDIIYWVFAALLVFVRIYKTNQGILRSFLFLGIALGMYLYHISVSSVFVKLCSRILGIPIIFVKKIRNVLLFWTGRCRIYVCTSVNKGKSRFKGKMLQHSRGGKGEKVKKEDGKNQNSQ